jgi:hypothetical protein
MERRANPRKPVLMSGAIEFAGGTINCLKSGRRSAPRSSVVVSAIRVYQHPRLSKGLLKLLPAAPISETNGLTISPMGADLKPLRVGCPRVATPWRTDEPRAACLDQR